MPTNIIVTKVASAYVELDQDAPTIINADGISQILPVTKGEEIGAAILYFIDGTTMNVVETVQQVKEMVRQKRKGFFQFSFGMN